jgi:hypothetical protein
MALTFDNPYTTQGVTFGSSAEIIEVREIISIPSVSVVLQFESEDENLPPKRIPFVVWSGEEYPGFGEWTKSDLEARIKEILA